MSTRATIKITQGREVVVSLYRHYDGYPAETGADLLVTALRHECAADAVRELLSQKGYEIAPTAGDAEHYYIVAYQYQDAVRFFHAALDWDAEDRDWINAVKQYAPAKFCEMINADRQQINTRLAQLRAEQPDIYQDSQDLPMIAIAGAQ